MAPLSLSDDEMAAIRAAAEPIPRDRRDAFPREVAAAVGAMSEVGPGRHASHYP
jgi:hypothetical protein